MLSRAYQILQNEICSQCGMPVYVCHSDDPDIEWSVERGTCFAIAAREKAEKNDEKKRRNAKNDDGPPPGEEMRPMPFRVSGEPIAALREPYWEAEGKRREEIAKSRPGYKPE